jgi:hypothetical protein
MLCQECADDVVSHFRHGSDNESSSCHWLDRLYCDSHDSVCREWWYLVSRRRARGSIQCRRVLENWHGDESNGCFGTSRCVDYSSCEPVVCVAAKDEALTDGIAHHSPQLSPTNHSHRRPFRRGAGKSKPETGVYVNMLFVDTIPRLGQSLTSGPFMLAPVQRHSNTGTC